MTNKAVSKARDQIEQLRAQPGTYPEADTRRIAIEAEIQALAAFINSLQALGEKQS